MDYSFWKFFTVTLILLISNNAIKQTESCQENGKFYTKLENIRDENECSKYFLCLDGEEFEFHCSIGLFFDEKSQTCKPENEVNCKYSIPESFFSTRKPLEMPTVGIPKTSSESHEFSEICKNANEVSCESQECILIDYICDGYPDCVNGEDEESCDNKNNPNAALSCNSSLCNLPDCYCSKDGKEIPMNLDPSEIPQIITLSFDDAITFDNFEVITRILTPNRRNPNGCPIKATFFTSHYNNNYFLTQKLWNYGHEIAIHSVTHRSNKEWWLLNATVEDWFDEMVGQANIVHKYSNVEISDIRGLRVPFLKVGWNRQFLMMEESGFMYDSSIVAPASKKPFWPYTLDFAIPHSCEQNEGNCPTRTFPGIWELIINPFQVNETSCPLLYSCPVITNQDEFYSALVDNFKRHYTTNKAPLQISIQASWLKKRRYLEVLEKFIDESLSMPNVWFVSNWQLNQWMKQPQPVQKLRTFKEWQCTSNKVFDQFEKACSHPNTCYVYSEFFNKYKYLYTCQECPKVYPWFRNEFGVD